MRDVIVDWGIGSFFGFGGVYKWMDDAGAKKTLVDGFGIDFFATLKAFILLAAMASAIIGGYRLFNIAWKTWNEIKQLKK